MTTHNLQISQFATLSAIKGNQFGREIYTSLIPFSDLVDFLEVFPDVQRDIIPRRVKSIKKYVLSGIEDKSTMRYFSAITVTCRGHIYHAEAENKISIDTSKSKLSVNDGQHRFFGISQAIEALEAMYRKSKNEKYKEQSEELKNMVIPLVIFNQLSENEEMQLFHDLNNLAQRPSRSSTIKLAQTDLYSTMSRELSEENEYLSRLGVETDKTSIQVNNPNTILLTTVYQYIKALFSSMERLTVKNYDAYKQIANDTLTETFKSLPEDIHVKEKYLISKGYTLRGIAKFINHCRMLEISESRIFKTIEVTDWTFNLAVWKHYGAVRTVTGKMQFGGSNGMYAVFNKLFDQMKQLDDYNNKDEEDVD